MRKVLFVLAALLMAAGIYFFCKDYSAKNNTTNQSTPKVFGTTSTPQTIIESATGSATDSQLLPDDISAIQTTSNKIPVDTMPESYTALINQSHLLPSNYTPKDLSKVKIPFECSMTSSKRKLRKAAKTALEKLYKKAKKSKVYLHGVSGYRSYKRQAEVYLRSLKNQGTKSTQSQSALAGTSEHQSGLAVDISGRSVHYRLSQNLGKQKDGKWLAKNAHKYGFIIRYPKGKEKITGYDYEPWHLRYVGKDLASYIYKNKLTLEEYYSENKNGGARK